MQQTLLMYYMRSLSSRYGDLHSEMNGVQQRLREGNIRQSSRAHPIVINERTRVWATEEQTNAYYVRRDSWEQRVTETELYSMLEGWGLL